MDTASAAVFEFENFQLDTRRKQLFCDQVALPIGPVVLDVLVVLARNAERAVTREHLLESVWGAVDSADANNVNQAIWQLRKTLGEKGARLIETVPRRGYRLATPVRIKTSPTSRNGTQQKTPTPVALRGVTPAHRSRLLIGAGLVGALILATVVVLQNLSNSTSQKGRFGNDTAAPVMAVLGFEDLAPKGNEETDWIAAALAHLVTLELIACDCVAVAPARSIGRAKNTFGLGHADLPDDIQLMKLSEIVGFNQVITGSFLRIGGKQDSIRIDVSVEDPADTATAIVASVSGPFNELGELVADLGADLRRHFNQQSLGNPAQSAMASRPPQFASMRLFAEALIALRRYDAQSARVLLEQVIATDPASPVAHAMLADVYRDLGQDNEEKGAAKLALSLASTMPAYERKRLQARYHWAHNEHLQAIALYEQLCKKSPGDVDLGINLARSQSAAGRAPDAFKTIESLKQLESPLSDDPRIDIEGSKILRELSRAEEALAWARRGRDQAERLDAPYLAARAMLAESLAHYSLGDIDSYLDVSRKAATALEASGNRNGLMRAWNNEGMALLVRGNMEGARESLTRTLNMASELGASYYGAMAKLNLGAIEQRQGNLGEAEAHLLDALADFRELDNVVAIGRALTNLAVIYIDRGDLTPAEQSLRAAEKAFRSAGQARDMPNVLSVLTETLRLQGKLGEALVAGEESLSLATTDSEQHQQTKAAVSDLYIDMGRLAEAERQALEIIESSKKNGMGLTLLQGYRALGVTRFFQAKYEESDRLFASALDLADQQQNWFAFVELSGFKAIAMARTGRQAEAIAVAESAFEIALAKANDRALNVASIKLARVLLQTGHPDKARIAHDRTQGDLSLSPNTRLVLDILDARIDAAFGHCASAAPKLASAYQLAQEYGHVPATLESGIALAMCEQELGQIERAHKRLQALTTTAETSGLTHFARDAAQQRRDDPSDLAQSKVSDQT